MRAHRGRGVAGLATATVLVATAFASGAGVASGGVDGNVIELYSDGLTVTPEGVATVAPGTTQRYLPGTRVPDEPDAPGARRAALEERAAVQRAWLAAGIVPGVGTPFEDMARGALADLHALVGDDGAVPAALHER